MHQLAPPRSVLHFSVPVKIEAGIEALPPGTSRGVTPSVLEVREGYVQPPMVAPGDTERRVRRARSSTTRNAAPRPGTEAMAQGERGTGRPAERRKHDGDLGAPVAEDVRVTQL